MVKSILSTYSVLSNTESDLLVNSSNNPLIITELELINTDTSDNTVALWITDGSNSHIYPCIPYSTIGAGDINNNKSKRSIPNSYKIRGIAETPSVVQVMITYIQEV